MDGQFIGTANTNELEELQEDSNNNQGTEEVVEENNYGEQPNRNKNNFNRDI